jgi:HTH-type transcriptional regulator/antitoxin HigA
MSTIKYTVIKNDAQYNEYCDILWELVTSKEITPQIQDEIDLLDVLIDKWDDAHPLILKESDPVELLKSFMEDHNMKAKDLCELLGVSKGYVSEILNYKKGFSKEIVRKLADRFKVRQEAFNKPYKLRVAKTPRKRRSVRRKSRLVAR